LTLLGSWLTAAGQSTTSNAKKIEVSHKKFLA
jgi:hypothetical protein